MKFTREVRSLINAAGGYRTGIVRAVSTAEGLDVEIGGGLVTGLLFLNSYAAPGIGDVVAVVGRPGAYLVLDKIGTAGATLGPNLLPNPGFEFGIAGSPPSGWNAFWGQDNTGVYWVNDEVEAHSSGAAAQFETASLVATQARRLITNDAVVVDSGVTYRIGTWQRGATSDANTTTEVVLWSGPTAESAQPLAPGGAGVTVASATVTSGWSEIAGLRTIPAGHYFARVLIGALTATGHTTPSVYVDDVSLRQQI